MTNRNLNEKIEGYNSSFARKIFPTIEYDLYCDGFFKLNKDAIGSIDYRGDDYRDVTSYENLRGE